MTRDELLKNLKALAYPGADPEIVHSSADHFLIAFIADPEIEAAYEAVDKWYA